MDDACHVYGVEFDYLNLGQQASNFSQFSTGDPTLFRPYFDVEANKAAGEVVAGTGVSDSLGRRQGLLPIGWRSTELQSVLLQRVLRLVR